VELVTVSSGSYPHDNLLRHLKDLPRPRNAEDLSSWEATVQRILTGLENSLGDAPSPIQLLMFEAMDCEEVGDWSGAEEIYRQIRLLPGLHVLEECRVFLSLASLCSLLLRDDEAWEYARQAVADAIRSDNWFLVSRRLL